MACSTRLDVARHQTFDELTLLRRTLRHRRGELDLLRTTKGRGHTQVGGPHARRLRILGEALPEVHASGDVQAGAVAKLSKSDDRLTSDEPPERQMLEALARPNQADLDEFRAGIDPLCSRKNKLGALLAQFPASFKDTTTSRDYLGSVASRVVGLFSGRRTSTRQLERQHRRDAGDARRLRRRVGPD